MKNKIINLFALLLLMLIATPGLALDATETNKAIRDKGANWVAGETSMSKLSPEEIKRRLMPVSFKRTGLRVQAKSYKYSAKVDLPAKMDWRNYNGRNYVTGIRDQGNCGSCWAFASTAALESRILITSHTPDTDLNLSEQSMVSCDDKNSGCNGGYPNSALSYLMTIGIPTEACYPYTSGKSGITGACGGCADWRQNTYRITGYEHVSTPVEAVKSAIVQYGPLVAGFIIYTDFLQYKSGVYSHVTGVEEGEHMVAIVGYDDAEQAWIAKNSWGPDWGEDGFFRIKSGANECKIEDNVYAVHYATVPGTSFVLNPASADFGTLVLPDQPSKTLPFTITNNGSLPLTNTSCAVTNPQFSVVPLNVSTIESAASADIQITYTAPTGKTTDTGELQVFSAGVTRKSALSAQKNTRPDRPVNRGPLDGAPVLLPVKLVTSEFADDDGDGHEATRWIIQDSSGESVYSGSFDPVNKTSFTVPSGIVQIGIHYYWQVIYRDDRGAESLASSRTSFTTVLQPQPQPQSGAGNGGCFIATAAFGSPLEKHVVILRNFRDACLINNAPGRSLVNFYYRYSPPVARFIQENEFLRLVVRFGLLPFIGFCYAALHYGWTAMCGVGIIILGIILTGALFVRRRKGDGKTLFTY